MKTRAVRLHGANDLRLDEFELPEIRDDEILAEVISDSILSHLRVDGNVRILILTNMGGKVYEGRQSLPSEVVKTA